MSISRNILYSILLEIDRIELTKVRKFSKKIREITNIENFKLNYHKKHPTDFFVGKVKVRRLREYNYDGNMSERFILSDLSDKSILITGVYDRYPEPSKFTVYWIGYTNGNTNSFSSNRMRKDIYSVPPIPFDLLSYGFKQISNGTISQSHQTIIDEMKFHLSNSLQKLHSHQIIIYMDMRPT